MAVLQVAMVSPEREIWSGEATMVLAKTLEGEVGILPEHIPLLGVLVEGGVVRIHLPEGGDDLVAAVHGGFLSVSDNQVSILAEHAELGRDVDVAEARESLDRALSQVDSQWVEASESEATRQRARLRAAGQEP